MSRSLQRVFGRSGRSFHQELGPLPNLTMKKEEMHRLPKYAPPSSVILIDSKRDETRCKTAIRKALNARVLGFDTESPIPESGCAPYAPSIVQISTEEEALVWKVSGLWHLPDPLREILECDAVKVGHGSKADAVLLLQHYCVDTQNIVDTHSIAEVLQLPFLRLQHLVGAFLGQHLPKTHTLSNWGARELSSEQVNYAACDSHASLQLYYALEEYSTSLGNPPTRVVPNALSLLNATARRHMASALHQINYLSKKKNHLSRLLREQQAAVSQIVRELRAIRGSLEVIDGIHEELQTATDDYSTASYTTPYYSYLVKRLPIESNSNKAASRSEVNGLFTGHQGTASSRFDTSSAGEETTSTTDGMADIDEQITNIEASEKMAVDANTATAQVKTPVRSKWWLWTSGGGEAKS